MTLECIDPNLLPAAVRYREPYTTPRRALADPLDRTPIPVSLD